MRPTIRLSLVSGAALSYLNSFASYQVARWGNIVWLCAQCQPLFWQLINPAGSLHLLGCLLSSSSRPLIYFAIDGHEGTFFFSNKQYQCNSSINKAPKPLSGLSKPANLARKKEVVLCKRSLNCFNSVPFTWIVKVHKEGNLQ